MKSGVRGALLLIQDAKDFYLRAFELNPLDAEIAYGLAKGEAKLEKLYQSLHPQMKESPYNPIPYFKEAIRLRPNGITYNYAFVRYLYKKGDENELFEVVRRLARIYPPSYHYLRKEKFWSPSVKEACKTGLHEAIRQNITVRNTHTILSSIFALEEDWLAAIFHYRESLRHREFQNNTGNYIRLGRLYLKNQEFDQAEKTFLHALNMSRSVEKDVESIYRVYKSEKHLERFRLFYPRIVKNFSVYFQSDILMARFLIDMKEYQEAKKILTKLNQQESIAQAYYWLARIAQLEKDWDSMELAIQKATVLDPANSQYHLIFSNVLKRLKKFDRAEREVGYAIEYQPKPTPWLFNNRAWIRWSRQDYPGAVEDWKSAITLKPGRADFHARIAEAYRKMGDRSQAMAYYQKAVELAPNNNRYQKKYLEIKAETNPS